MSDKPSTPDSSAPILPDGVLPPAGPSWQEQDGLLREMWMQNKTPQVISEHLGRSVSAIMTRAARLGLPRRAAPGRKPSRIVTIADDGTVREERRVPVKAARMPEETATQTSPRICLMCLTTFQSLGRHNRICPACKNSSEYASASTLSDIHLTTT